MICFPTHYLVTAGLLLGLMLSWSVFSLALCEMIIKKGIEMKTKTQLEQSTRRLVDYKKKLKERLEKEKAKTKPVSS